MDAVTAQTAALSNNRSFTDAYGDLSAWLQLTRDAIDAGEHLASVASAPRGDPPPSVALALLCRSLGHMRSIASLIDARHVVEARIITRSLYEGLFLAVALKENGPKTYKALQDDHNASRTNRGRLIATNTRMFSQEQIKAIKRSLSKLQPGRMARPADFAKKSPVEDAYLIYAQLSADSAHPSLDSLERYVIKGKNGRLDGFSSEVADGLNEMCDTVGWACMAFLGLMMAVRDVANGHSASPRIEAVAAKFQSLTGGAGWSVDEAAGTEWHHGRSG